MLTFAGQGYTPEFVANFERIARQVASGEETAEIVFAPDEICAPLMDDPECHCDRESVSQRDHLAAEALTALLGEPVREYSILRLDRENLARLRAAFGAGTIRKACEGCQWSTLCDEIAKTNFSKSVLFCDPTQQ